MTEGGSVPLRRDRTRLGVARLAAGVTAWLSEWRADGPQSSQIRRCGDVLNAIVDRLGARVGQLPTNEAAFVACRSIDADLAVIERLFHVLADRFAQRRHDRFRAPLVAADQIIWSCVLQTEGMADERIPLPLAYIEPAFSATATPRTKPPPGFALRDRQLAELLRVFPVPLIGLPTSIVDEPWWLVLVPHEVGHHIQYDLDPEAIPRTGLELVRVGGDAVWGDWKHEVFADMFWVLAVGPAALQAVAQLEWDAPERMAEPRDLYPPVMVRLALMSAMAEKRGFARVPFAADSWSTSLSSIDRSTQDRVAGYLSRVPAIAATLHEMQLGHRSVDQLRDQAAPLARSDLSEANIHKRLAGEPVALTRDRTRPRLVISAAFRAYQSLAAIEDEQARASAQTALRARTLAAIQDVADVTVPRSSMHGDSNDAVAARLFEVMHELERE